MVSPRTINLRRVFAAPKPPSAGSKRRFSETDLEAQSGACMRCAKRICHDPDCTESDLLDIHVDDEVRSEGEEISECETCESESEEEEDMEEKQESEALFDTVLKEMTDMFEFEFDTQSPPKADPKVKKTVCWAAKLVVVIGDPVDDVRDETDCESEEE